MRLAQSCFRSYFNVEYTTIKGPKSDLILLPGGKFKDIVMNAVPNAVTPIPHKPVWDGRIPGVQVGQEIDAICVLIAGIFA